MKSLLVAVCLVGAVSCWAEDPKGIVFGSGSDTAKAVEALDRDFTVSDWGAVAGGEVNLFDYEIAVFGMDVSRAGLSAQRDLLDAYVRSGGVVLGMRNQATDDWLPSPVKVDKAYHFGEVLLPDHPLFTTPQSFDAARMGKVHGGSIYKGFYALGEGWVPLVSTGKEQEWDQSAAASADSHYGIIELEHGHGRIILCQMIPDYAFVRDDALSANSDGGAFFGNLLAYVTAKAADWSAYRGKHAVPAGFVRDLGDLLAEPTAEGDLPMSAETWRFSSEGAYSGKADRRGVYTIGAADAPARKGSFGQVTCAVQADAAGAACLRFYSSDDYCGGSDPTMVGDKRVASTANFKQGVREKQVLVNGEVVWRQDVLGRNEIPASRRFHIVRIPAEVLARGNPLSITLRTEDLADTAADDPFATDTYWAGVQLLAGTVSYPPPALLGQGFSVAEECVALTAPTGSIALPFEGEAGRYALALRVRDEHAGQSRLALTVNGAEVGGMRLTADDYQWWWATVRDVALSPGDTLSIQATRDGTEDVRIGEVLLVPAALVRRPEAHTQQVPRSPLYRPGEPAKRAAIALSVAEPAGVAREEEITSQGVPFAYGALPSLANLALTDADGRPVPMQADLLASWPDGSAKWALVSFPASVGAGGSAAYRLAYGTEVTPVEVPGPSLAIRQEGDAIAIDTGVLQATISKTTGTLLESVAVNGTEVKAPEDEWGISIHRGGQVFSTAADSVASCEVLQAGPLRAIVRRIGRHRAQDGSTFCEYDLRQEFHAGSPLVRVHYTFTHKEDSKQERLDLVAVDVPWAPPEGSKLSYAVFTAEGANGGPQMGHITHTWTQATADGYSLEWKLAEGDELSISSADGTANERLVGPTTRREEMGGRLPGWTRARAGGRGFDVAARWFWQTYPKAVSYGPDGVRLDLKAQVDPDPFVLWQGEGVWNEFMLRFAVDDPDQEGAVSPDTAAFRAFEQPLRAVVDPAYVATSLALGQWAPEMPSVFPEWEEGTGSMYDAYMAKRESRKEYGIDNFGDDTFEWGYGPAYTFWSNSEYDHHHGMLLQYLRSGDYRFFEIGEQASRQYRDVDCYHWAPGSEHLIGAPHHHNAQHQVETGWVSDHCVAGASTGHSWVEGLITYYFLTGDPRAFETYNAMGDWYVWTVENNAYGAGGQERGPGWTLIALAGLYNATYDDKYRLAMERIMEWVKSVQDPVRGVVSVPISEQPSYEGGSSFMHGILGRGLARYYEATGDPTGRRAMIGIAQWIVTESMGEPGMFYYKQAPRIKGPYRFGGSQEFSALSYAFHYTGDPLFGQVAAICYDHNRPDVRSIAWLPYSLHHLIPVFSPLRAHLSPDAVVLAPDTPAMTRVVLRNVSATDVEATVGVEGLGAGLQAQVTPASITVPAGSEAEATVEVSAGPGALGSFAASVVVAYEAKAQRLPLKVEVVKGVVSVDLPADRGLAVAPMVTGAYAETPRDASFTGNPWPPEADRGTLTWEIEVPADGRYVVLADCWWLDQKGNSFYVRFDDGPPQILGNDGDMGRWHWAQAEAPFDLAAGKHRVVLSGREEGGRLRTLRVTNAPAQ